MAAFYFDNDVSYRLAELLLQNHHQVTTAPDLGLANAKDPIHLLTAARQAWILVTHNRKDFVLLHEAWHSWPEFWGTPRRPAHGGILVIPQVWPPELPEIISSHLTTTPSTADRLYRWRPSDGWTGWQLGSTWSPIG